MQIPIIGVEEAADIDDQLERILSDLGRPDPPLSLPAVRELLKLDFGYYSSSDTTLVDEVVHAVRMAGLELIRNPTRLWNVIKERRLCALWVPQRRQILIDQDEPSARHRWMEAHETAHGLIPWHQEFLHGDATHTLDPTCHAIIEAEANYGAGQLLFLGGRFRRDAADLPFTMANVQVLSKRYANSLASTLWRMVEQRDITHASFGLVSAHPKHKRIRPNGDGPPVRYFITSPAFRREFPSTTGDDAYGILRRHVTWSSKGPVLNVEVNLKDSNGELRRFQVEGFCTGHAVLTRGSAVLTTPLIFLPPRSCADSHAFPTRSGDFGDEGASWKWTWRNRAMADG